MDESYFGLRQRPFRSTPDADSYYPATGHETVLEQLRRAILDEEGIALLTGEPGTGKTLLCHRLLGLLGADVSSALLTNTHLSDRASLLQAILYDLSLPYEGRREQELRLALTDHLLKTFAAGRRTVLVVDEAHHLSADLLEELRLLGNLEAKRGKAVQVVLVGLPVLETLLRREELSGLNQRLVVRPRLEPLGAHEAADYLFHQLRWAGGRPEQLLSGEAAELLARGTRGVPRLLNQAARQALALAQIAGTRQVDAEAALEALAALGLDADAASDEFPALVSDSESPPDAEPVLSLPDETADGLAESDADDNPPRRVYPTPSRPA